VSLFGRPDGYIFYSINQGWSLNIHPDLDVIIYTSDNPGATILTDFPNAVQISPSGGRASVFPGPRYVAADYDWYKTLISTMNLGGPMVYIISGSNPSFQCAVYGADGTWNIQCALLTQPSTFTTDFPNAILLTGGTLPLDH
jgi:hypothetical protein